MAQPPRWPGGEVHRESFPRGIFSVFAPRSTYTNVSLRFLTNSTCQVRAYHAADGRVWTTLLCLGIHRADSLSEVGLRYRTRWDVYTASQYYALGDCRSGRTSRSLLSSLFRESYFFTAWPGTHCDRLYRSLQYTEKLSLRAFLSAVPDFGHRQIYYRCLSDDRSPHFPVLLPTTDLGEALVAI